MQEIGTIVPIAPTCEHPECPTILSSNNKGGLCTKHKSWQSNEKHCQHGNCGVKLRSDNISGLCQEHRFDERSSTASTSKTSHLKQLTWPTVPCSYCNTSPVNALLNEKRKCQTCSKATKANNYSNSKKRQRDDYVPFLFADGCKRVFRSASSVAGRAFSPDKAISGAILMDYIPMAMHLQRDKSASSPVIDSFAMVTESFINDMHAARISFATNQNQGTPLQVTLQLPEEEKTLQVESRQVTACSIDALLTKTRFGKLYKATGAHEQPDDKLLDILNMEFHEKPELLGHIADLLVNGIIRCKNVLIKILTIESYSRHASVDIHNESQVLESTMPVQGRLFCGTVSAADGKGLKQKMVIATNTMNALCTCSVTLGDTPQVSIGPGYASKLSPHDCQLFLASAAVAKFKKIVASETDLLHTSTTSMSQLRQLTTSFHHPSTFSCWRRSFEPFCDILHMPATVFTLCDLPSFSGYGSNSTSMAMLSSQLLAVWARAYFHHNSMLTEAQMATFMILYDSVIKDSKPWIPLQAVVEQLKKEFNKSSQVNIFRFAFVTSLSAVADAAGDGLPAANAKIAANISLRFSNLFVDN